MGKSRNLANLLTGSGDVKLENLDTIITTTAQAPSGEDVGIDGYMSKEDKAKLNSIQQGATQDLSKEEIDHMGVDAATIAGQYPSDFVDRNLTNVNSVPDHVADQFRGLPFTFQDLTDVQKTQICTGDPVPGPPGSGIASVHFESSIGTYGQNPDDLEGPEIFIPNLAYGTLEIILDTGRVFSEQIELEVPKSIESIGRDGDLLSIAMSDGEVKQFTISDGTDGDTIKSADRHPGDHHITFVTADESGFESVYEIPIADGRGILSTKRIDNTIRVRYTDGGEDFLSLTDGEDGTAIKDIVRQGSIVKITNTDGSQHEFEVKDGNQIQTMVRDEVTGLVTVTMTDNTKKTFNVPPSGLKGDPGDNAQLIEDISVDDTGEALFHLSEVKDKDGVIVSAARVIKAGGFKGEQGIDGKPFDYYALSYIERAAVKGPRGEVGPPGFTGPQGLKGEPGDSGSAIQGNSGNGIKTITRDPNTGEVVITTTGIYDARNGEEIQKPEYMAFKTVDGQSDKIISAIRYGNAVEILTDAWSVEAQNAAQALGLPIPGKYSFSIRDGIDGAQGNTGPQGPIGVQGDIGDATKGDPGVQGGPGATITVGREPIADGDLVFEVKTYEKTVKRDANGDPILVDFEYQYEISDSTQTFKVPLLDGSSFKEGNKVPIPSQQDNEKFLTNNGTNAVWQDFPSQIPPTSGNDNLFLTNDGNITKWASVSSLPDQYTHAGKFLGTDGASAAWLDVDSVVSEIVTTTNIASGVSGTVRHNVTKKILPNVDYALDIPVSHRESGQYHLKQYIAGDSVTDSTYNMDLSDANWTGITEGEIQFQGSQMMLAGVASGIYIVDMAFRAGYDVSVVFWLMSNGQVLSMPTSGMSTSWSMLRSGSGQLCRSQAPAKNKVDYVTHRLEEFTPMTNVVAIGATNEGLYMMRSDGKVYAVGQIENNTNYKQGLIGVGGIYFTSEIDDPDKGLFKGEYINKFNNFYMTSESAYVTEDRVWTTTSTNPDDMMEAGHGTDECTYRQTGRIYTKALKNGLDIMPVFLNSGDSIQADLVNNKYNIKNYDSFDCSNYHTTFNYTNTVTKVTELIFAGFIGTHMAGTSSTSYHSHGLNPNNIAIKSSSKDTWDNQIPMRAIMKPIGTQYLPCIGMLDMDGNIWVAGYYMHRYFPDGSNDIQYNDYGMQNATRSSKQHFVDVQMQKGMTVALDKNGSLWGGGYYFYYTGFGSGSYTGDGNKWVLIAENVSWFSCGGDQNGTPGGQQAVFYKIAGSEDMWCNGKNSGNGSEFGKSFATNTGLTAVKKIFTPPVVSRYGSYLRQVMTHRQLSDPEDSIKYNWQNGRILLKDYGMAMCITGGNSQWNMPWPWAKDEEHAAQQLADGTIDVYHHYMTWFWEYPSVATRIATFIFDSDDQGTATVETVNPLDLTEWGIIDAITFTGLNHSRTSIDVAISVDEKLSWSPWYSWNKASQDINWAGIDFNEITSIHFRIRMTTTLDHLTPIISKMELNGKLKGSWCVESLSATNVALTELYDNQLGLNIRNVTTDAMLIRLSCDLPVGE